MTDDLSILWVCIPLALAVGGTLFAFAKIEGELPSLAGVVGKTRRKIEGRDSVLQFSQDTLLELGEAAEIVMGTMRAFGLSIKDTDRIVDNMTKAYNSSPQTMRELKESLTFVSAQAAATGLSLEETATLLGTMANNARKASIAGTGLRRNLIDLQDRIEKEVTNG